MGWHSREHFCMGSLVLSIFYVAACVCRISVWMLCLCPCEYTKWSLVLTVPVTVLPWTCPGRSIYWRWVSEWDQISPLHCKASKVYMKIYKTAELSYCLGSDYCHKHRTWLLLSKTPVCYNRLQQATHKKRKNLLNVLNKATVHLRHKQHHPCG